MDNYRVKIGERSNPITLNKLAKLPELEQANYIPMKDVYLTFKELNQLELVRQAGIRQQYIDQAVSLNLAFPVEAEPKFINQVHLEAYQAGVKTLYYMRTESVLRGDIASRAMTDCLACDG
jgi:ribonucleoside-diphosphate reductase alpha chain